MNILDRWRVIRLKRDLAELQAADHASRDQAETTVDMMHAITLRTAAIVTLQNKIRELEGAEPDVPESTFGPELPSNFGVPTKGQDHAR